jgi:hypothetical protein
MMHIIKTFLKFGSQKNILDLFENGTIYMNPIEYFRTIEDNKLRGDKYEGTLKIINSLPGTFRIPNAEKEISYKKIHLTESYEVVLGNLYCLYCVSSYGFQNPFGFKIDERNMRFGTHCLMIKDNGYFLDSIERELKKNGYKYYHGFVKYYDKNEISKDLTLFDKPNEFEYQKEFRFYVDNEKVEPIILKVGSLHDKAKIFTVEEIMTLKLEKDIK